MTALDNNSLGSSSESGGKGNGTSKGGSGRDHSVGGSQHKYGSNNSVGVGSRLSLRGQKRALPSDISPAPEPRTSHRIRTNSSGDVQPDIVKANASRSSKNASLTPSSSPAYRAAQLGLRRHPISIITSSANSTTTTSTTTTTSSGSSADSSIGSSGVAGGRMPGVCPLANLGNTCFLNSVLYALRFLPGFTHDLHHLHTHLQHIRSKSKSSGAGEGGDESLQQRVQLLSELHAVFVQLAQEERSLTEVRRLPAMQPYHFLQALRVANPMFEGTRQQDAHELLHCLLDQLCHLPQDLVGRGSPTNSPVEDGGTSPSGSPAPPPSKRARRRSDRRIQSQEDRNKSVDVVGSKFVGRMCLETCCSECEKVTGREETFLEVCIPVKTKENFDDEDSPTECEVFMSALCEEECLRGNNKYWCDACSHHNEARRSVHYSQLPHHLLIHVKRFSAPNRNMNTAKCSDAMPAPLQLSCFCRSCIGVQLRKQPQTFGWRTTPPKSSKATVGTATATDRLPLRGAAATAAEMNSPSKGSRSRSEDNSADETTHLPYHLSAMVCHLGVSLSSGHYMTYVRVSQQLPSTCPTQQDEASFNDFTSPASGSSNSPPNATSSPSASNHHQAGGIPASPGSPGGGTPSNEGETRGCSWLSCCALQLQQALPQLSTPTLLTNGAYTSDGGHTEGKSNQSRQSIKNSNSNSKPNNRNSSNKSSGNKANNSNNKSNSGSNNSTNHSNNNSVASGVAGSGGMWLECDDEKIKLVSAAEVVERMRGTLITPYLLFYSRLQVSPSNDNKS